VQQKNDERMARLEARVNEQSSSKGPLRAAEEHLSDVVSNVSTAASEAGPWRPPGRMCATHPGWNFANPRCVEIKGFQRNSKDTILLDYVKKMLRDTPDLEMNGLEKLYAPFTYTNRLVAVFTGEQQADQWMEKWRTFRRAYPFAWKTPDNALIRCTKARSPCQRAQDGALWRWKEILQEAMGDGVAVECVWGRHIIMCDGLHEACALNKASMNMQVRWDVLKENYGEPATQRIKQIDQRKKEEARAAQI
jgi:hypothetical protein